MNLNKESKKFACVLQLSKERPELFSDLPSLLPSLDDLENFAFIKHDQEDKLPHVHIVLTFAKRKRGQRVLNMLSKSLSLAYSDSLSVEVAEDLGACVQYLVHKNDPDKFQYDPALIVTNFSQEVLNSLLESASSLDAYALRDICIAKEGDLIEIAQEIGLQAFSRHRYLIEFIISKYHLGFKVPSASLDNFEDALINLNPAKPADYQQLQSIQNLIFEIMNDKAPF